MTTLKEPLQIKPKFYPALLLTNPVALFLTIWFSIIICGPLVMSDIIPSMIIPFIITILLAIFYFYLQYIYSTTTYTIVDSERIIYSCDYILFQKNSVVKINEIREISDSQNVIQKLFGLGSVTLHTRITDKGNVSLIDIENHQEIAAKITEIIFQSQANIESKKSES